MSSRDYDLDHDWCDDTDDEAHEDDDDTPARCPECGDWVHSVADQCPGCGRWLSEADRRAMWADVSHASWIRWTAVLVLLILLAPLLLVAWTLVAR